MQNPADLFTQLSLEDIHGIARDYSSTNAGGDEVELANRNTQNLLGQLHACTLVNLAECNQAIVNYLADETNQNESIYPLLANAFVAKASGAQALLLEPNLAKKTVIARLTAWHLVHFPEALQTSVLESITRTYETKKREKSQSPASLVLSQCLLSDTSPKAKWQALVNYCSDPDNKSRRLFKIIETNLDTISLNSCCLDIYHEACDLIKREAEPAEVQKNYQRAMLLLSTIPPHELRADSPFGSYALLAPFSEICERTQQYQLGLAILDKLYPDERLSVTQKSLLARVGLSFYESEFPDDIHQRKMKLFMHLFENAANQTDLTHRPKSAASVRATRFFSSFNNAGLKTAVIEVAVAAPVVAASYVVPPIGIGLTIGIGFGLLLGVIGSGIYGGVHALSRKPLDGSELDTVLIHLQRLHREPDSVKAEFMASVVERYGVELSLASCSNSSALLFDGLNCNAAVSERWESLLYYMCKEVDKNNGKKMAVIIRELLEARYPAEPSTEEGESVSLLKRV
jgi:hypothetical protein